MGSGFSGSVLAEHRSRTGRPGRSRGPARRAARTPWRLDRGEQLRARAVERIHGAGLDQALDHAPVDGAQIDVLAELVERPERAALAARPWIAFDRGLAQVLDRAQPEADRVAVRA